MSLFKRNPPESGTLPPPDETTLDRRKALEEARGKLRRAHQLKRRSSVVAANLRTRESRNHYAQGLWESYEAARKEKPA